MTKFDEFGLPEPTKYPQMPKIIKMNERIRQLAEQAGFETEGDSHIMLHHLYLTGRMEKFAELIVRECLEQVDKVDNMLEDDKEKVGVAWVGLAIAKHFGVE